MLLSCATNIKFYDCSKYELAHVYSPSESAAGNIKSVSWCKDGSWLGLVPNQGKAQIIGIKNDVRLLQNIICVPHPTTAVFQRTTKKNIAIGTRDGGVLLYDLKTRSIKKEFACSETEITGIDWNAKDTHLAVGTGDGQINLYSNTTNQKTNVFNVPGSKSVSVVRFHCTNKPLLGTASDEGVVATWDINVARRKFHLSSHKAPVTDLVFATQNPRLMISVGLDRLLNCYDLNGNNIACTTLTDHPLSAIDMAPDDRTIAVASTKGSIFIYDLRNLEQPIKSIAAHSTQINHISYRPPSKGSTSGSTESLCNITEEKFTISTGDVLSRKSFDSIGQFSISPISPKIQVDEADEEKISNSGADCDLDSFFGESFGNLGRLSTSFATDIDPDIKKSKTQTATGIDLLDVLSPYSGSINSILKNKASTPGSTPKRTAQKVSFMDNQNYNSDELHTVVRNVVEEVLDDRLSDMKYEMNRNFSNLQTSVIRQFLNLEEFIENSFQKREPNFDHSNLITKMQQLEQENIFLRNKINELLKKNAD